MLFVLIDGWALIIGTLASSFAGLGEVGMTPQTIGDLFNQAMYLVLFGVVLIITPA